MMIKQAIFSLLLAGASGFSPVSSILPSCRRRRVLLLEASRGERNGGDVALTKFFGLVATVSALSFGLGGMPAKAQALPDRLVDNVSGKSSRFIRPSIMSLYGSKSLFLLAEPNGISLT